MGDVGWLLGRAVAVDRLEGDTEPGIIRDATRYDEHDHTTVVVEVDDGHQIVTAADRVSLQ